MSKQNVALIVAGLAALVAAAIRFSPTVTTDSKGDFETAFRSSFSKSATESCEKSARNRITTDGGTVDSVMAAAISARCTCVSAHVAKNLTADDMHPSGIKTAHVEQLAQEAMQICTQ